MQKPVHVCFIDYEKAFDHVYHDIIIQCLDHVDMNCNDKRVIEKLYWQQTAPVRFGDENTLNSSCQKGRAARLRSITKTFQLVCRKEFQ